MKIKEIHATCCMKVEQCSAFMQHPTIYGAIDSVASCMVSLRNILRNSFIFVHILLDFLQGVS